MDKLEAVIPDHLYPFITFFNDIARVMDSAFGYTLDPNYKDVISKLRESFKVIRWRFAVSETVKMHILMVHVEQFIEMTGRPLGEFSEQSLEDSHSLFQEYWKRFLIKDIDSEKYLANYKKCILTLNASNV